MPNKQSQGELFERAAKCQRAFEATTDAQDRATLRVLRDLWMNLANASLSMTEAEVAKEIAVIENVHAAAFGRGEGKAAE